MIRKGDRLENPVTGEALVFHRTSRETDGQSVLVETIVRPDGFVAARHLHPYQSERFEVLEGELGLRVGDDELVAGPGDIATVEPGTPHRFWNAGEGDARFLCEVRPALGFQSLIETMFTLAAASKTNRKGLPNPLRLAVIAKAHFDPPCASRRRPHSCKGPGSPSPPRSDGCSATDRRTAGHPRSRWPRARDVLRSLPTCRRRRAGGRSDRGTGRGRRSVGGLGGSGRP